MSIDVVKYNFLVVGAGFLGSSIIHLFNLHANIKVYDKYKPSDTMEDGIKEAEFIWMCLPTPMKQSDGSCDLSILEENMEKVNALSSPADNRIVIIKSTVSPGTCAEFQARYTNVKVVSCPEFLTARAHLINSVHPSRIIIGTPDTTTAFRVEELFRYRFGNAVNIYTTSWESAELAKLGANIFFATKVMYFNFIYEMAEKLGLEYDEVKDLILSDGRIAISHTSVPGWDGDFGFGGMCFSKDICSFIFEANKHDVDAGFLEEIWKKNLKIRKDRDWERIPGVVSKDK